jgi:hypothetical protein
MYQCLSGRVYLISTPNSCLPRVAGIPILVIAASSGTLTFTGADQEHKYFQLASGQT